MWFKTIFLISYIGSWHSRKDTHSSMSGTGVQGAIRLKTTGIQPWRGAQTEGPLLRPSAIEPRAVHDLD